MSFDDLMYENDVTVEQYYFCLIQLCLLRLSTMGRERNIPAKTFATMKGWKP